MNPDDTDFDAQLREAAQALRQEQLRRHPFTEEAWQQIQRRISEQPSGAAEIVTPTLPVRRGSGFRWDRVSLRRWIGSLIAAAACLAALLFWRGQEGESLRLPLSATPGMRGGPASTVTSLEKLVPEAFNLELHLPKGVARLALADGGTLQGEVVLATEDPEVNRLGETNKHFFRVTLAGKSSDGRALSARGLLEIVPNPLNLPAAGIRLNQIASALFTLEVEAPPTPPVTVIRSYPAP